MCQILGMNCASPTDFTFSLKGFCRRGGDTDKHAHGWGAAIYLGKALQCFKDAQAACRSPLAHFVLNQHNPFKTYNMMAHIRYATVGEVSLENVHPFTREFHGLPFSFCHNGECPRFAQAPLPCLGKTTPDTMLYRPVGDTDSEAVFCSLLNALRAEYPFQLPKLPELFDFLSRVCLEIVQQVEEATTAAAASGQQQQSKQMPTIFNFLLGCGPYTLFAYSWPGARPGSKVWNGLHYIIREPPFSTAQLIDDQEQGFIDFSTVTTPDDRVAVVTTKPLTHETGWAEVPKGKLVLFERGRLFWSAHDIAQAEQQQQQGISSTKTANKNMESSPLLLSSSPSSVMILPHHRVATTMAVSDGEDEYMVTES